jgi:hypothetical protein
VDDHDEALRELRRRARARVGLPAKFLLLMALLGVVMGGFVVIDTGPLSARPRPAAGLASYAYFWLVGVFAVVWCGVIGYGAWEMDRLGNYRAARLAAWMALVPVPVPAWVLWFIGALLGVAALSDPAVRAAFASGNPGAREAYLAQHAHRPGRRPRRPVRDPGGSPPVPPPGGVAGEPDRGPPDGTDGGADNPLASRTDRPADPRRPACPSRPAVRAPGDGWRRPAPGPSKWPGRLLIGGLLATTAGLISGATLPDRWRTAFAYRQEPREVTLRELAENGVGDNPHVTVTGYRPGHAYVETGYRPANAPPPKPDEHIQGTAFVPLVPDPPAMRPFAVILETSTNRANSLTRIGQTRPPLRGILVPVRRSEFTHRRFPEIAAAHPGIDLADCYVLVNYEPYQREDAIFFAQAATALTALALGVGGVLVPAGMVRLRAHRRPRAAVGEPGGPRPIIPLAEPAEDEPAGPATYPPGSVSPASGEPGRNPQSE